MFFKETLTQESILKDIRTICEMNYSDNDITLVERVLSDIIDLFHGKRPGYQACDTGYHNLFHTFQTIPPFVGMIDGWNKGGGVPRISKKYFRRWKYDQGVLRASLLENSRHKKYMGIPYNPMLDFLKSLIAFFRDLRYLLGNRFVYELGMISYIGFILQIIRNNKL